MHIDPIWLAVALSGLACLSGAIACYAALRAAAAAQTAQGAVDWDQLQDAGAALARDLAALRAAVGEEAHRQREGAEARDHRLREAMVAGLRELLASTTAASSGLRDALGASMKTLADSTTLTTGQLGAAQAERLDAVVGAVRTLGEANERRFADMRREGEEKARTLRDEVVQQLAALSAGVGLTLTQNAEAQKERLDGVTGQIRHLTQRNDEAQEKLRAVLEGRLDTLRQENAAKLEEMRQTVDEKLQGTLEQRLGASFKQVSDQLEQVFRSVGEMQTLATGVGDLKRVLTNVKTRGTWAEVSLGALLDQVMTPEQYGRNVEVQPGSGERVEYAVRLPGQAEGDAPVWLPIDAKFPSEDYERLLEASERSDLAAVEVALKGLEQRIRLEGATICRKYVCPPHSTDFGILYLPTEGLYAEVIRRPGLVDALQRECRIVVAGPTVLLAILNSLRMGFRTLAVQQRSSEVWQLLAAVKSEFGKYGDVLDKVKKKLAEASDQIDKVAVRRRQIDRRLSGVERLPDADTARVLAFESLGTSDEDYIEAAE